MAMFFSIAAYMVAAIAGVVSIVDMGGFLASQLGIHRMLGLVVGERAREREVAGFRAHVAAAREVEIDAMRGRLRVALDDEDGMPPDDDRQRHAREPGNVRRPQSRCV